MSLFNTETEETIVCKPGHKAHSVKSGAVSPNSKFVATTGTDGFVRVFKLSEDFSTVKFLCQTKICDKKVSSEQTFNLDIQFLEDDNSMIVSGNQYCGFIQIDDEDLENIEVNH